MELNKQQREAVENSYDKDTVLIAAAGSGKTRVLTERVAYILNNNMATPDELLVLTFTNKASNEMKERIEKECGELEDLTCGTFHSVFLKILRKKMHLLGLKSFTILDSYNQRKIIMDILSDLNIIYDKEDIGKYLSVISNWKSELISPTQALNNAGDDKKEKFVANLYTLYQDKCWKNSTLDFDDILVYSYVLMCQKPYIREDLQKKFKYIMVDESQDTNKAQMTLITMIKSENNNVMLIGDDFQSIYAFRGARPDFMVEHNKVLPGSKVMFLEQNYRSTKNIINASNSVIVNNTKQIKKRVTTQNNVGNKVELRSFYNGSSEVHNIASEIYRNVKNGSIRYQDVAILYRTNALSRSLEEELSSYNIPYVISGGLNFMDRKEIKDITCFYKLKNNPFDEDAIRRVLSQLKGVGKKSIDDVIMTAKNNGMSYIDIMPYITLKRNSSLPMIYNLLKSDLPVDSFAEEIIRVMGMIIKYREIDTEEAEQKLDNIGEFINIAKANKNLAISDFVDTITLSSSSSKNEDANTVKLMTIHSAKGLEFPTVYLVGLESNILPHARAKKESDIEEERRLLYVAMTRAKERLVMSYAKQREVYGKTKTSKPSRFIEELDEQYIDRKTS